MPSAMHPMLEWFINDAYRIAEPEVLVDEIVRRYIAHGVPIWRYATYVSTLHPELLGDSYLWTREAGQARHRTAPRAFVNQPEFQQSPIRRVYEFREPFRVRLDGGEAMQPFPLLHELKEEGATDYIALPLFFSDGSVHTATVATDAPGGFSDGDIDLLVATSPLVARYSEHHAVRAMAARLLDLYVGHDAGARILSGEVLRGAAESMQAAIWLSDLRGFSGLSDRLPRDRMVGLLNAYFDCMAGPVTERGGQILKFVGDAILAIFPVDAEHAARAACRAALEAAIDAQAALGGLNPEGERLRAGIALHVGEVAYGNIGAAARLDFTVIGPAVNLAARIESLTAHLGEPILMSADFIAASGAPANDRGSHPVKGLDRPLAVFTPGAGADAA